MFNAHSKKVPKALLSLVLTAFFLYNVWESLDKYFARKTTMATSERRSQKMELPFVTLCHEKANLYDFYKENNLTVLSSQGKIKEEMLRFWANKSLSLNAILGLIWIERAPFTPGAEEQLKIELGEFGTHSIHTVDTAAKGRCYTVKIREAMRPGDKLVLWLHNSAVDSSALYLHQYEGMIFHLHDPKVRILGQDIGLVEVAASEASVVYLQKKVTQRLSLTTGCEERQSMDNYQACLKEKMAEALVAENSSEIEFKKNYITPYLICCLLYSKLAGPPPWKTSCLWCPTPPASAFPSARQPRSCT